MTSQKDSKDSTNPDSKLHGADMGPIWVRQGPGGPHVGPINFAFWEVCIMLQSLIVSATILWLKLLWIGKFWFVIKTISHYIKYPANIQDYTQKFANMFLWLEAWVRFYLATNYNRYAAYFPPV